jgi:hypothetical protein
MSRHSVPEKGDAFSARLVNNTVKDLSAFNTDV